VANPVTERRERELLGQVAPAPPRAGDDRPFDTVDKMNEALVENWNSVVSPEDTVLYLGDLVPFERRDHVVLDWLDELHRDIVFIRGNHDKTVPIKSHETLEYEFEGTSLYLTHYPEQIPHDRSDWGLYGHHHNNYPDEYPFLDPEHKRVNVSIELLGYEPIPLREIKQWIKQGVRLTVRPGVDRATALQGTE
jgi:calcineurin-like phosphoesterase family protein